VFCIYLRTNSYLCHLHHKLIGFYNRDEKCLLRGKNGVFKYSSLRFVFKGFLMGSYADHVGGYFVRLDSSAILAGKYYFRIRSTSFEQGIDN
jgi:hypothetical protein